MIDHALSTDDHAATIGLIRLIDPATIDEADRIALLQGSAGVAAPLVQAAWFAEPRVRYEAALKVVADTTVLFITTEPPLTTSGPLIRTLPVY